MQFYNTRTHAIDEFSSLTKNKVLIYVCGITPYDTTHLGHAFTYISFDALIRYLESLKYDVTYTQNVTDINDRDTDILKRAQEQNIPWNTLAEFWTERFLTDMNALNWRKPDHYLKASEHMPTMIKLIEKLLSKEYAYEKNGNIFLDVTKVKDYGLLSKLSEEEMLQIAKQFEEDLENPLKRHKLDITLWRAKEPNQPIHIPSFDSPFGKGRPGWHIECSAMAICSLDEQIDIHGGGEDLIYPHHESEIAQSESATDRRPFANFWIHSASVSYQGAKMSKSLGNLILVSDLLKTYSPNTIRFLLLSHHYKEAWEFKEADIETAKKEIEKIESKIIANKSNNINKKILNFFEECMNDNLSAHKYLDWTSKNITKFSDDELTAVQTTLRTLGFIV